MSNFVCICTTIKPFKDVSKRFCKKFVNCGVCLFFFFKQKTAYEMRISDWSSDVCSSDLVTIGSDIYDMSQKGGSVTNVTVRGQSHPNVTDLPMTRVGYARVSTIDQDLDIQVARLKAAGCEILRSETGSGASRTGRTELERSEEHTSELQSLMRTSYA